MKVLTILWLRFDIYMLRTYERAGIAKHAQLKASDPPEASQHLADAKVAGYYAGQQEKRLASLRARK